MQSINILHVMHITVKSVTVVSAQKNVDKNESNELSVYYNTDNWGRRVCNPTSFTLQEKRS